MILRMPHIGRRRFAGFGDAWVDYCNTTYQDPTLREKCNSKPASICPLGICLPMFAPWTQAGRAGRGLPSMIPNLPQPGTISIEPPTPPAPQAQGGLGAGLWIGIGVLVLGAFAVAKKR